MVNHREESIGLQESCFQHAGPCVDGALMCPMQAWGSPSPTSGRKDLKERRHLMPRIAQPICHVQASQFLGFTSPKGQQCGCWLDVQRLTSLVPEALSTQDPPLGEGGFPCGWWYPVVSPDCTAL